jgi:hypothetical protein
VKFRWSLVFIVVAGAGSDPMGNYYQTPGSNVDINTPLPPFQVEGTKSELVISLHR